MTEQNRENKNAAAFAGAPPQGVDPRTPMVSTADVMKNEFGLEIPTETVPLPSLGKVYPVNHPLHGRETVEIRGMTTREEDILTSRVFLKKGTVLTELIKSSLVDKRVDPLDLLIGDRNALMVAIRITGYTQEYTAEVTCSECNEKAKRSFDLSELPIEFLKLEPLALGQNVFGFKLPYLQKDVKFRFLTGRDEEEISTMAEKMKKIGMQSESNVTSTLLHAIISIDGITDKNKIAQFVRMMPARDSLALRNYISMNDPGIIMKQETTCPLCQAIESVEIPITTEFLWPHAKR